MSKCKAVQDEKKIFSITIKHKKGEKIIKKIIKKSTNYDEPQSEINIEKTIITP